LKSVLTQKLQENKLVLVDAIKFDEVKSKKFVALMKIFKITNALIIDEENKKFESLSAQCHKLQGYKAGGAQCF